MSKPIETRASGATPLDELLDDLFHGAAWAAFIDEAILTQGWPEEEPTRQRACRYYEEELTRRQRGQARVVG